MTTDEELEALRQANRDLREQVAVLSQALTAATETISTLQEQIKHLQEQLVSGGLRTELGLQILCRLRSYLSTLHKQGMDLLHALHQTFLGSPIFPALSTPLLNSYENENFANRCPK